MPPRAKRACKKKLSDCLPKEKGTEDEKENIRLDELPKIKKNDKSLTKAEPEDSKADEEKPPENEKEKLKTIGFWSKKVQDLELEDSYTEKKKSLLYVFDGTEESDLYQEKRKPKKKIGISRKKKSGVPKCNKLTVMQEKAKKRTKQICQSEGKAKQIHRISLFKEKLMLSKEREKLADRGKNFTFSTGMPSLGITSTPALNKDNLIGASNFLFLSPIISEEAECDNSIKGCTPLKSKAIKRSRIKNSGSETPKGEAELKKLTSKRVLRSGRVLNT